MKYLDFIDATRAMNPQQRSLYFNNLSEEERSELVEDGGEYQLMMVHARMVLGAEQIEKEEPSPKRDHMMRLYNRLEEQYLALRNNRKIDEDTIA